MPSWPLSRSIATAALVLFLAMAAATAIAAPVGTCAQDELKQELASVAGPLATVLAAIADAVVDISESLRTTEFSQAGTTNSFGDEQLQADLHADDLIFKHLRACAAVASASSEEQSDVIPLNSGGQYSVAFDPLDGSSILDANFAVGSIFGVWPGASPVGQTGADQVAALYALYGPKTLLVLARPGDEAGDKPVVQEWSLVAGSGWQLRKAHVTVGSKKIIAPANLRAARGNAAYKRLLDTWIDAGHKLRYSGGMVPDVHHILAKAGGVFCNPTAPDAPAKLRLLYECAPLAYVLEAAGGASHDGSGSILAQPIRDTGDRTRIALGSREQVAECVEALQGDAGAAAGQGSS